MMLLWTIVLHSVCFNLPNTSLSHPLCDELEFVLNVTHTIGELDNGAVEVLLKNSQDKTLDKLEYYFYKDDFRGLLTDQIQNSSIDKLSKGNYFCLINVSDVCYKKIEFKID